MVNFIQTVEKKIKGELFFNYKTFKNNIASNVIILFRKYFEHENMKGKNWTIKNHKMTIKSTNDHKMNNKMSISLFLIIDISNFFSD